MRDLRDPQKLGEALADLKTRYSLESLRAAYDAHPAVVDNVAHYNSNPTTIEKYGYPRERTPTTV